MRVDPKRAFLACALRNASYYVTDPHGHLWVRCGSFLITPTLIILCNFDLYFAENGLIVSRKSSHTHSPLLAVMTI